MADPDLVAELVEALKGAKARFEAITAFGDPNEISEDPEEFGGTDDGLETVCMAYENMQSLARYGSSDIAATLTRAQDYLKAAPVDDREAIRAEAFEEVLNALHARLPYPTEACAIVRNLIDQPLRPSSPVLGEGEVERAKQAVAIHKDTMRLFRASLAGALNAEQETLWSRLWGHTGDVQRAVAALSTHPDQAIVEALGLVADAMLRDESGNELGYGWDITALNRARPRLREALSRLKHGED